MLSVSLVHPGSDVSHPCSTDTVEYQGELYSVGWDADHGTELWKSDGTAQGSSMVADATPGPDSSQINSIQQLDGLIFFTFGTVLWRSDGTEGGTFPLLDYGVNPKPKLVEANNEVFFSASNRGLGPLWVTDGTVGGTRPVFPDGMQDWGIDKIDAMVSLNGVVYLTTVHNDLSGEINTVLIRTDGTDDGTSEVYDLTSQTDAYLYRDDPTPVTGSALTVVGDDLYLASPDWEIWRSEGTPETTGLFTFDLGGMTRSASHLPSTPLMMEVDDKLLAYDLKLGWFITDGSTATLLPQVKGSVTTDGSSIYFSTFSSKPRHEQFWRSDGTPAGNTLLASIAPVNGWQPYRDAKFYASQDGLTYFTLTEGSENYAQAEVWALGGTEESAYRVDAIDVGNPQIFNGKLYFCGVLNGVELFSMNPTTGAFRGTVSNPYANSQLSRVLGVVTIFLDLDSNGVLDAGEPSAVTDANGEFAFYDIAPGQYTLGEIGPSDSWRFFGNQLDPYNKPSPITVTVSIQANRTEIEGLNLADTSPAIVAGNVFRDLNGNNNPDSGEGESFTVYDDLNYNGKLDAGEPSTRSAAGGSYRLSLPNGGLQAVRMVSIKGWDVGQYDDPPYTYVAAVPGQTVTCNLPVAKMELVSGVVFLDSNQDGKQNKGEQGIADLWIQVHGFSDHTNSLPTNLKGRTDASGHYSVYLPMVGLPSDLSYLIEPPPTALLTTASSYFVQHPKDGASRQVAFGVKDEVIMTVTIHRAGEDQQTWFTDTAMAGWTVYIDKNKNNKFDAGTDLKAPPTVPKLKVGSYSFPSIKPGKYTVRVLAKAGFKLKSEGITVTVQRGLAQPIVFDVIKT